MQTLLLSEYATLPGVDLTADEVHALRSVGTALALAPGEQPGRYDLIASSYVGVITLGERSVVIRPKIPIPRLLFLLAYRLDPRRWQHTPFDFTEQASLLEAIIPAFVAHMWRAVGRGLLQGYRVEEETLATVRGRIRIGDQVRSRYGIAPPVEVRYYEFTEDIAENRLLKAAIGRLGRLRIRSERSRQMLREFDTLLERVQRVEYHPNALPDIHYTRLNEHYRPAIELARLILRATTFEAAPGAVRATTFLVDMNKVFEDFVVVALREALGLSERTLLQGARGRALYLDEGRRLGLAPDISWWDGHRCRFVGDVKYKHLIGPTGPSGDVYQMLAYTIAAGLPGGMLIYARGEAEPASHRIVRAGKQIDVVTLALDAAPEAILAQIAGIAARIRSQPATG